MRVETAVGVDAGVEQQTDVVAVREDAVNKGPAGLAELFLSLGIPEKILAVFADGDVGVHAAAVDANDGLRKEGSGEAHFVGDLATDEFVELDLVGGVDDFGIAVVDFELRRRDFRVVFFVLEAHGALDFGGGVDESAERVAGERVVVAPGVDVFEFAVFVVVALGVGAFEEEALDFVGGVERVAFFFVERFGVMFEDSANVGGIGRAVLVDYFPEDENFAAAEIVGGSPVKRTPIDAEAKVAFALGGEATDGRTVEGEVVPGFEKELFVVIEHVQAAFEVAEEDGDGLDALFGAEIFEAFFLNFMDWGAILALLFGFEIEVLEFVVGEREKIAQFSGHESPWLGALNARLAFWEWTSLTM